MSLQLNIINYTDFYFQIRIFETIFYYLDGISECENENICDSKKIPVRKLFSVEETLVTNKEIEELEKTVSDLKLKLQSFHTKNAEIDALVYNEQLSVIEKRFAELNVDAIANKKFKCSTDYDVPIEIVEKAKIANENLSQLIKVRTGWLNLLVCDCKCYEQNVPPILDIFI